MTTNGEKIVEVRPDIMSNFWQPGQERILRQGLFLKPYFSDKTPLPTLPTQNQISSRNPLMVDCNGWQIPYRAWDDWVLHMEPRYGPMWKTIGIFDAIKNSTIQICPHKDVVLALAQKWYPKTSTFVFKWGEASITLEDVFVLGGFSATGESVSVSVLASRDMVLAEERLLVARRVINKTPSKKCTYNLWLKHFADERNGFGDIEHEAFLVFWLSKFIFPKVKDTVGKHVHVIAIKLAMGVRIALGPAVLASIYRDLTTIESIISKSSTFHNLSGKKIIESWSLMHLVQVWAWERFPTLGPNPNSIREGEPRLFRWNNIKGVDIDGAEGVMETDREEFKWRPYCTAVDQWDFKEFYPENEEWAEVEIGNGREAEQFAMFIRHSELVGFDGFIEPYLPHRVAMQFGMNQDVPSLVPRVNGTVESAWAHYKRPFKGDKVYIPPRLLHGDVTACYDFWWNRSRLPQLADEESEDKLTLSEMLQRYKV